MAIKGTVHPVIPVLQLLARLERVEGRKKLQKTVHILQELGVPFQERFEYSYYGMYSAQLKSELDSLDAEELVKETEAPCAIAGGSKYIVSSTPKLKSLLDELAIDVQPAWTNVALQLNKLSAQVLEGISTVLFLRRTESDEAVIRSRLLTLKPHLASLADSCIQEAACLPKFA